MQYRRYFTSFLICCTAFCLAVPSQIALAQSSGLAQSTSVVGNSYFDATYVPDDALAAVVLSPEQLFQSPTFQLLPTEALRVQGSEQLGVNPFDIAEVRAVISLNPESMQPQFGVMVQVDGEIDLKKFIAAMGGSDDSLEMNSLTVFPIAGLPGAVVARVDKRTLYVGMREQLFAMLQAQDGSGALARLLKTMPRKPGLSIALTMDQIGPMVSQFAGQQTPQLAPDLQPITQIPGLTDAVTLNVQFDGKTASAKLMLVAKDDIAARRIQSIVSEFFAAARNLGVAELSRSMKTPNQSAEMDRAIETYANRVAGMLVAKVSPDREANHVTIELESDVGLTAVGILGGIMLPAIQSARITSSRMKSSNNMKQIMLALHNHHSAFRQLPVSAIMDEDGKPLLSWRVKILPFIGEQGLYQEFHLDEPWDSKHNLPLLKKLPAVYQPPGKQLAAGMTTYQAAVGEGLTMEPLKVARFRDILDGLSNTLCILETNDEAAVPWSKPVDLEIDMDAPLAQLGEARQGGFHVGMGDGAVIFLTKNIDVDLFKALLTRAGGEVIGGQF